MKKPSLLIVFLTVFIDLIGFGIVLPLLPKYAERYGAGGWEIGVIVASYSFMQFFFAPFWGRLSDRIGRRPVILLSTAGSVVAYGLFGLSAAFSGGVGLAILLGSRMFAGLCGANLSVASAYIADLTTAENRSKGMGLIGMAFGFGFILGPVIGAVSFKYFGLAGPGWIAAAICATNFLLACFLLVESRKPGASPTVQRPGLEQWKRVFRNHRLRLLVGLFFLANFTFISFEVTLPLLLGSPTIKSNEVARAEELDGAWRDRENSPPYDSIDFSTLGSDPSSLERLNHVILNVPLHDSFDIPATISAEKRAEFLAETAEVGLSPRLNRLILEEQLPETINPQKFYFNESRIGYIFAYCGLIAALIQGGAIGRLVKRFGERKLIWSSLVIVAISMILIPATSTVLFLLLSLGLFAGASGVNRAPTMGMISQEAAESEQGATLGVAQSVGTLARIVGPLIATTTFSLNPTYPYVLCAVVAVLGALWAYCGLRRG